MCYLCLDRVALGASLNSQPIRRVLRFEWVFRSIYDLARFSTVVLTKSMHTVETSFNSTERYEGVACEAAAVLASPGPLGVVTMGTFPLSLIAFGWIRRQKSDDPVAGRRPS